MLSVQVPEFRLLTWTQLTLFIGHGAPAILSCLWLEDYMNNFFPEITRDYRGLKKLIAGFSAPGGFPRCSIS